MFPLRRGVCVIVDNKVHKHLRSINKSLAFTLLLAGVELSYRDILSERLNFSANLLLIKLISTSIGTSFQLQHCKIRYPYSSRYFPKRAVHSNRSL